MNKHLLFIALATLSLSCNSPKSQQTFDPTWESLEEGYQTPDWFRDAKFGIWAHWGPQCQAEYGDWYARNMYIEGNDQYQYHVETFGHPSQFGFKDIIHQWKAENWNPEELIALYKRAGAKYFVTLANHHDNLDLYDSSYQQWNSTKVGPMKDIVGGWKDAVDKVGGMRFGVSVHASHAWCWYETSRGSDTEGEFAGVPYDGWLTKEDGEGTWWGEMGLDPQELYAQNHPLSKNNRSWDWEADKIEPPTQEYIDKFYNRTIELIDNYNPDLIYFDDTELPFAQISDAGLKIAAHMYNHSIKRYGDNEAIVEGKILDEHKRKAITWDVERGATNEIMPQPWQCCTCIGSWHYDKRIYDNDSYKSAKTVIQMLVDIISKNGNMLLSVPIKGDGTIDEKERKVVEEIGAWMNLNSESVYGTRPWKILGEGPALQQEVKMFGQGFNEGRGKALTAEDFRFVTKDGYLYATAMGWSENGKVTIHSLSEGNELYPSKIKRVEMLATGEKLKFERTADGLIITLPEQEIPESHTVVFKIK